MTARDHRHGLLGELGRAIANERQDVILQALHVGGGAFALGATQAEIDAAAATVSDHGDAWDFCAGPWCGKPAEGGKCILWPRHDGECARYVGP